MFRRTAHKRKSWHFAKMPPNGKKMWTKLNAHKVTDGRVWGAQRKKKMGKTTSQRVLNRSKIVWKDSWSKHDTCECVLRININYSVGKVFLSRRDFLIGAATQENIDDADDDVGASFSNVCVFLYACVMSILLSNDRQKRPSAWDSFGEKVFLDSFWPSRN